MTISYPCIKSMMAFIRFISLRHGRQRFLENQVRGNGHPSDVPKLLLDNLFIRVYTDARGTRNAYKYRTYFNRYTLDINPVD